MPQIQGAGLIVGTVTALPPWTGATAAALVAVATVVLGGMRSVSFVQAFQYWFKLTALAIPVIFAGAYFLGDQHTHLRPPGATAFPGPDHGADPHRRDDADGHPGDVLGHR